MKMKLALIAVAAVVAFAANNAYAANPASINIAISGSSALYLELGQASASSPVGTCVWDDANGGKDITLNDTRTAPVTKDTAHAWITWTASPCSTGAPTNVNIDVNTDSTVGNRCFLANPRCLITIPAGGNPAGDTFITAPGAQVQSTLPTTIVNLINTANSNTGIIVNGAASDIRPEDAAFASERAFTPCGNLVPGSTQYRGLGYQTATNGVGTAILGSAFQGSGGAGSFNVVAFNLTGTDPITSNPLPAFPAVEAVGAVPIVVFVNPANQSGFGSLQISNVDSAVLAAYLDGTLRFTGDMIPGNVTNQGAPANVFVREPLSGTYNTMEYNIPNTLGNQSSQDVGNWSFTVNSNGTNFNSANDPFYNCTAAQNGTVALNPLVDADPASTALRGRAIGTGNEVKAVTAKATGTGGNGSTDNLGYAFWSVANFASGTGVLASTAKYLTVDGVDPIQETWSDGLVPQAGNGLLGNVTLSHVRDGSYPIWSFLRIYGDPGATTTALQTLVKAATAFELGLGLPAQPDFIPLSSTQAGAMGLVRSHFTPPGITVACGTLSNGNALAGEPTECGGDVGGQVYTQQADADFVTANGSTTGNFPNGITGRRR